MDWLVNTFNLSEVATSLCVIALVIAVGMGVGSLRISGVKLGVAGVLFAGLLFGHYKFTLAPDIIEFASELGLVFFVYSIGVQVGPGFLASLRRQGLPLNMMAVGIVLLGAILAVGIGLLLKLDIPSILGIFSGATTNTPSLAAGREALKDLPSYTEQMGKMPALSYAVSYPFGIMGIILTMLVSKAIFRVNIADEDKKLHEEQEVHAHLDTMSVRVDNQNLVDVVIEDIPAYEELEVVVSRIYRSGELLVARPDTKLSLGDVLLCVGESSRLAKFRLIVGSAVEIDIRQVPTKTVIRWLIVTKRAVLGKNVKKLGFAQKYGVTVTRVARSGVEFPATPHHTLHYGDSILAVGSPESVERVAEIVGNSQRKLEHPEIISVFIGIVIGIVIGSIPIYFPGAPVPVKLGLAGGPLLVAILLSWLGRIGPLVWYLPAPANFMIREVGIVLFLASVGLRSGDKFVETLLNGDGLTWIAIGAVVTFVPLITVALIARIFLKLNFVSMCGLLAGSMTDPPALQFASDYTNSEGPNVAYATVYPLTMIMRIVIVQAIVILFIR